MSLRRITTDKSLPLDAPAAAAASAVRPLALLACSSRYGSTALVSGSTRLLVYATQQDIVASILSSSDHAPEPRSAVDLPGVPAQLKFSCDESRLFALPEAGSCVWLCETVPAARLLSTISVPAGDKVLQIYPNPGLADLCYAITASGALLAVDVGSSQNHEFMSVPIPPGDQLITTACWSRKGKQLACGTASGTIIRVSLDGSVKGTIPAPPALPADSSVRHILWLENSVFLVAYACDSDEPAVMFQVSVSLSVYITLRRPTTA